MNKVLRLKALCLLLPSILRGDGVGGKGATVARGEGSWLAHQSSSSSRQGWGGGRSWGWGCREGIGVGGRSRDRGKTPWVWTLFDSFSRLSRVDHPAQAWFPQAEFRLSLQS